VNGAAAAARRAAVETAEQRLLTRDVVSASASHRHRRLRWRPSYSRRFVSALTVPAARPSDKLIVFIGAIKFLDQKDLSHGV
jgi:hypothetical protein